MTYTITKDFDFAASHHLNNLPDGHKCARDHGHNYLVRVELSTEQLDHHGFVLDYGDLNVVGGYLDDEFDHRNLNDVLDFNPTAENLAEHLYGVARQFIGNLLYDVEFTLAVGVSETPKAWAWFTR